MNDYQFDSLKEMLGVLGTELVDLTAQNAVYTIYSGYISLGLTLCLILFMVWAFVKTGKLIKKTDFNDRDMRLLCYGVRWLVLSISVFCICLLIFSDTNTICKAYFAPKILMLEKIIPNNK
jgi:hypothetical protein